MKGRENLNIMVLPTIKKITPKQISILRLLAKLRMASIYHIVYCIKPELRGRRRSDPDFETTRKSVSRMIKRLQDAKYIRIARPPKNFDIYYYLSPEGLRAVYAELNITEYDRGRKSGFDYELGYFDWRIPPFESPHFQFQTDIHAAILSINREVEIDTIENASSKWVFGGIKLANICSVRDNLHASPRETKIKEAELYKPDGELLFKQSRYDSAGKLEIETLNQVPRVRIDQEHFFLEHDRKSEYGERLDAKFLRLNKRLEELESRDELKYYKGMVIVLDAEQNTNATQINLRHMKFVTSFQENCKKYAKCFNIITTTDKDLPLALLCLRREYSQSFGEYLLKAFQFPVLAKTFVYGDLSINAPTFTNINPKYGNVRVRYNASGEYLCLFINIEGLSLLEWEQALSIYTLLREAAVKHNEEAANGDTSKRAYRVLPIVTYRKQRPYAPQMIHPKLTSREQESFFKNLYMLNLGGSRPILYKDGEAIDFEESVFILE